LLFSEPDAKILAVFLLRKPSAEFVREFLLSQNDQPFSYDRSGATRDETAPKNYNIDHHRVQLGSGAHVFERAREALRQWKMFEMHWIQLCWPNTLLKARETVAVLISHAGFWSLNPSRIVYVIDEHGGHGRYGFAYGTLPEHSERGEERFTVEFHRDDDSVWYDVYAFSRPGLMARLAYPYARMLQRRFARDSMNAMKNAVAP
jgi:uncharacterized protein (UPF0548 family)